MHIFSKLDTRTKLFFILLLTLMVFIIDKFSAAVCLLIFSIIIRLAAKITFRGIKFFKNLTLLALFIMLIQTLFGPGESYIAEFGSFGLKREGFFLGLVIVCRLTVLFMLLPVFTETTPPDKIACGLYTLGFNYRIAFLVTFVFNLIPFFQEEAHSILDAQKLRGKRTLGIRTYINLLVPLVLGAMRKAQVSSVAMDSRAFGVYKTRTWTEKPQMKPRDFWFITGSIIFSACILFFNYYDVCY